MRRLARRVAMIVGVLLVAAVGVAFLAVRRQLPDRSTPHIADLAAPVQVTFDARGIPTIRARTMADALRVEGYLQARERLFQMELGRRVAGGEVSELVGAAALPLDSDQRIYGFAQVAEAAVERLPPDERASAEALAEGINAFIVSHRGRWGLEFELLHSEPRPWRPSDSVRMLLLMEQQLTTSWQTDLQAEALAGLPPERQAFLQPVVTAEDVLLIPDASPPPPSSTSGLLTRAGDRATPRSNVLTRVTTGMIDSTSTMPDLRHPVMPRALHSTAPCGSAPAEAGLLHAAESGLPGSAESRLPRSAESGLPRSTESGLPRAPESGLPRSAESVFPHSAEPGLLRAAGTSGSESTDRPPRSTELGHAPPLEVLGVPLEPFRGARPAALGSNAWVVSGAHAAAGKPLLASDPHLGFSAPQVWYPMRIELVNAGGKVTRWIQGVTLPGVPGIVLFQNERLAMSFTNTGTDVQDLYREPTIGERVEQIRVKDGPTEELRVQLGKHGPMVKPGLALHWAALDPATLRLPVEAMNLATDWTSLNAAADRFLGPAQNIMYADAAGHIGWRVSGVLPLRPAGDAGRAPVSGTDGRHDWQGYLPIDQMPRVLDPPSGRIVTANQRVIGTAVGRPWPASWASPTRARRVTELLAREGLDAQTMRSFQLDTVGTVHREVVERLLPLLDPQLGAAFKGWDGRAEPSSRLFRAAEELRRLAYRAVVTQLLQGSSMPATEFDWYDDDATLLAALRASPEAWRHAGLGERDAVLRSVVQTVRLTGPSWGEQNRLRLNHPLGRGGGLLGALFNPPGAELAGCGRCVRVATPRFGQSMRMVVDFAHPEATTLILPLGVSGHLGSEHRQDTMPDWLDGDLDGTRTQLHAPPVGPTLLFQP